MTALAPGTPAPDFALPAAPGPERVTLAEHRGRPVVLLFYPLAFSGVCTEELCGIAGEWDRWSELGATVLGISVDSPFVTRRFARETGVDFPLLSDFNREATEAYGVLDPDFFGLRGVAKRSVFVIDPGGTVAWSWSTDDADVMPPFDEVWEAVRRV